MEEHSTDLHHQSKKWNRHRQMYCGASLELIPSKIATKSLLIQSLAKNCLRDFTITDIEAWAHVCAFQKHSGRHKWVRMSKCVFGNIMIYLWALICISPLVGLMYAGYQTIFQYSSSICRRYINQINVCLC